jgi:hypothetical protein
MRLIGLGHIYAQPHKLGRQKATSWACRIFARLIFRFAQYFLHDLTVGVR